MSRKRAGERATEPATGSDHHRRLTCECAPIEAIADRGSIAVARIVLPRSYVRLSAGRSGFSGELQALCFLAGANSIFYGEKLLTTGNPDTAADRRLFERLGLRPEEGVAAS